MKHKIIKLSELSDTQKFAFYKIVEEDDTLPMITDEFISELIAWCDYTGGEMLTIEDDSE